MLRINSGDTNLRRAWTITMLLDAAAPPHQREVNYVTKDAIIEMWKRVAFAFMEKYQTVDDVRVPITELAHENGVLRYWTTRRRMGANYYDGPNAGFSYSYGELEYGEPKSSRSLSECEITKQLLFASYLNKIEEAIIDAANALYDDKGKRIQSEAEGYALLEELRCFYEKQISA